MQLGCLGSDVSSPWGFGAKTQPTNDLVHIWAKRAALVARFLWILLKRNNFLYKNSHSSLPSMLHHAHRGAGSAYYKVGEANWQWVSWQTQIQKARMSGRGLGWGRFWGAEDERWGPRRDAQGIDEDWECGSPSLVDYWESGERRELP